MENLQDTLKELPHLSGVYLMSNEAGEVLYVGKAKDLKKRVSSYFCSVVATKTRALISHVKSINTIMTETETDALLLENDLIKKHHPKYNILFRDDKSYPYIFISDDQFPRIALYRGPKKEKGQYFGPYPNSTYARQTIHLFQKIFLLRSCQNSFFASRSRPCLQYQIHRCSAPCVSSISMQDYGKNIQQASQLLLGKSFELVEDFAKKMKEASQQWQYELAAQYRDKIKLIRSVQGEQALEKKGSLDVLIYREESDMLSVYVLMVRGGKIIGHKNFFQKFIIDDSPFQRLISFMGQYYSEQKELTPPTIVCQLPPKEIASLQSSVSTWAHHSVTIKTALRGARRQWYHVAELNAKQAFEKYLMNRQQLHTQFVALQNVLTLPAIPKRIECFDISHIQGESTVASCVVFGLEGALKKEYRHFNVMGVTAGDDVAAIKQAIIKRYHRFKEEGKEFPTMVMVDGGKTQLHSAAIAMGEMGIDQVILLGIAKDEFRKSEKETIYIFIHGKIESLSVPHAVLLLLIKVRDEAHRFALFKHRKKRAEKHRLSVLDRIPGIGSVRREILLKYFGGIQGLLNASVEDFKKIQGIHARLAKRIYDELRASHFMK